MSDLIKLQELGVTHLKVESGQAVAVNPYKMFERVDLPINLKWYDFESLALPPLPCHESVKEGTYPIGRFKEQNQSRFLLGIDDQWFDNDSTKHSDRYEDRTVLVLSEPVAEKPEGESEEQRIKNTVRATMQGMINWIASDDVFIQNKETKQIVNDCEIESSRISPLAKYINPELRKFGMEYIDLDDTTPPAEVKPFE